MFKSFFIGALTTIMCSSGCLPFVPAVTTLQDNYYCDTTYMSSGARESFVETIYYDSMDYDLIHVDILAPNYEAAYGSNCCAPTAGAIATVYYDYYHTNLISNYDPMEMYGGTLSWKVQNTTYNSLQRNLYEIMGTNVEAPGTSVAQFKTGMTSYYNNQGYNVSYNNVTNSITPTNVINLFNQEKIILLFLNSYEYYPDGGSYMGDTYMSLLGYRSPNGHVVVAFAYIAFNYYTGNEVVTDEYMYVCFGDSTRGYIPLDNTSYIQEAYTLNIT